MQPAPVNPARPSLARRSILLLSYALLVITNTLSSMGYLGPSQADVAGKWRTSLVPAGYAFSIWGVIFALQGAASVYAALEVGYNMPAKCAAVNAVAIGWPLAWLFETAWLVVFPRQTTLTFYLSSVLLWAGLAAIGWTAGRTHAVTATGPPQLIWALFVLPTSTNAAWMSVASCLGLNVLAVSQGIPAKNELALAATLAVIVAAVGAAVILVYQDVVWGCVLIWAFVAVIKAHPDLALIQTLSVVAIGVAGLCSAYVAVRYWQSRRGPQGVVGAAPAGPSVQQPLLREGAAVGQT